MAWTALIEAEGGTQDGCYSVRKATDSISTSLSVIQVNVVHCDRGIEDGREEVSRRRASQGLQKDGQRVSPSSTALPVPALCLSCKGVK